jgi:glutaminyl-peptide cyclotransferase
MLKYKLLFFPILFLFLPLLPTGYAGQQTAPAVPPRVPTLGYEVVKSYPHDPNAFTQGLLYHEGYFYESTGRYSQSSLRKVEIETGAVLQEVPVESTYFAEGLALFNGQLFQLTWQNRKGFIYDLNSFSRLNTFEYTTEGWGLTNDNRSLILTDGSNRLRFLDPATFQVQRTVTVVHQNRAVDRLNEIEYIKGEIFANIWLTDRIVRIDPETGRINAFVDLSGLLSDADRAGRSVDVLNGIAYDESGDRLFVTGKLWPKVFEIKLKTKRNEIRR